MAQCTGFANKSPAQSFDQWREVLNRSRKRTGRALIKTSLRPESLSVSFLFDAKYFFISASSTWIWNKLKSLALTSQALNPGDKGYMRTNHVIQSAAIVAKGMPCLSTMVLWNYKIKKGFGAFVYQASIDEEWARLTRRAIWDVEFQPDTIRSWAELALECASTELLVVKELL